MVDVPLPKWELTDPFGRNALKRLRYELKLALSERDEYRTRVEEILAEQGNAVNMMAKALAHEQSAKRELERRLRLCDDARKDLGEKINELIDENNVLKVRDIELRADMAKMQYDYDELSAQHEKLVRGMTDKGVEA